MGLRSQHYSTQQKLANLLDGTAIAILLSAHSLQEFVGPAIVTPALYCPVENTVVYCEGDLRDHTRNTAQEFFVITPGTLRRSSS